MENGTYYRPKLHTRTLFNLSVILCFLFIGFSVFYYLVIFLPQKEEQKIEQQKLEQDSKKQIILYNKTNLDNCLQNANSLQQKTIQSPTFKNLNREDLKILLEQFSKQKDECYKRYPQ